MVGILGYGGGADNSRYPGVWEGGVLGYREGEDLFGLLACISLLPNASA